MAKKPKCAGFEDVPAAPPPYSKGQRLYTIRHGQLVFVTFQRMASVADAATSRHDNDATLATSYIVQEVFNERDVICGPTRFLPTPLDAWIRYDRECDKCIRDQQVEVDKKKSLVEYHEMRVRDAIAEKSKALAEITLLSQKPDVEEKAPTKKKKAGKKR